MTWEQYVAYASAKLEASGIDDARTNAEYLAACATNSATRADWRGQRSQRIKYAQAVAFSELFFRRLHREPLQYVLGEWEFFGLPMITRPGALIPRPETEILVEEALREASVRENLTIVDAGTGSGAIALALASRLRTAKILACDISDTAIEIATENREALGLHNVSIIKADMLAPEWMQQFEGKVDLLVSNPPYVSLEDFNSLDPELRQHEPREALTDNASGVIFYEALTHHAQRLLSPSGTLLVELGYDLADRVRDIAQQAGLTVTRVVKDLAGIERVLVAERVPA